jgi:uncharacterized protein (TIGR02145 family)
MSIKCKLGYHTWDGCKCSKCGKTRDEQHNFVNNICKICGQGTFTDPRDGKVYKIIIIGIQTWLAENLAYKADKGCWAYVNDKNNVAKYGYLYDWETAKNVCPTGWHLPTKEEFDILFENVGGSRKDAYNAFISNGNSGFSALFAGMSDRNGNFYYLGTFAYFWSCSPVGIENANFLVVHDHTQTGVGFTRKECGLSVRCIKDT